MLRRHDASVIMPKPMFVLFLAALQVCTGQEVAEDLRLSYEIVSSLAGLPLHCYNTEFPNKLNQVLNDVSELLSPSGEAIYMGERGRSQKWNFL